MNWGYKILSVIIIFIIAMLSMVYYSFQQSNEMVDANYYDKEMQYQHLIDASNKLNKIDAKDLITQQTDTLEVKLPSQLTTNFSEGQIIFQRNSDEKRDQIIPFTPNSIGEFNISTAKFIAGNYTAKISWKSNGELYYKSQKIFIQK